jgi:hypothetical protein
MRHRRPGERRKGGSYHTNGHRSAAGSVFAVACNAKRAERLLRNATQL